LIGITRRLLLEPRRWPEVQARNNIADPRRIPLGDSIRIPYAWLRLSADTATVVAVRGEVREGGRDVSVSQTLPEGSKLETGPDGSVALLVWGDPTLYDSTLRIASRLKPAPSVRVIPGITSIHALTASHAIPLNEIGAPLLVTTGRRLRDDGWPAGSDTLVVMLDGDCAFQHLDPSGVTIWWGAYVGMPQEITLAGPLAETGPRILKARTEAREANGWIMDVYLLRRKGADREQR